MKNVAVYVDGFNLYHAIDDLKRPHLKWLDLHRLAQSLLRSGEQLVAVHYFSAFATWRPESFARHRAYVKALKTVGVDTHISKFKKKDKSCFKCKTTWVEHEEKETDVYIAVKIVSDAYQGVFDRAILISADTDLLPAIRCVQENFPEKEVFVAAPPARAGAARALSPKLEITKGRLEKCLLPGTLIDPTSQEQILRPTPYTPPYAAIPVAVR